MPCKLYLVLLEEVIVLRLVLMTLKVPLLLELLELLTVVLQNVVSLLLQALAFEQYYLEADLQLCSYQHQMGLLWYCLIFPKDYFDFVESICSFF